MENSTNVKKGLKVVVLIGSSIANKNTLATLIKGNVNVVGAVMADQKKGGINFKYLKMATRKQGFFTVFLQILERILYRLLNTRRDKKLSNQIFNKKEVDELIDGFKSKIFKTDSYSNPETLSWVKEKEPDLIVIHTPYWVGKKVRDIVNGKVLGGHPGMTQFYRGVHSPFWAVYNNDFENIGYSVFWIDSGVDTGDLIYQGKIIPRLGDTYVSLSWRGMVEIASSITKTLNTITNVNEISSKKNLNIKESTLYYHPTVFQYIKYRLRQSKVR